MQIVDQVPDFSRKPTLHSARAVLRPFRAADVPAMTEALSDPDVGRLTGSYNSTAEAEASAPDAAKLREWYLSRNDQTDRLDLAVVSRRTGQCVGEAVLNDWDRRNRSCNFRILIGPAGRDQGLGTDATRLMLRHAFTVLGLNRVSLEVYDFNPRARRVYEKAGFVAEGVLRQALRFEEGWVDATVMAALASEWRDEPI